MLSTDGLNNPSTATHLKTLVEFVSDRLYHKANKRFLEEKVNAQGYIYYNFNNRSYFKHRLKYAFYIGVIPMYIDHIDGNNKNNDLSNLRLCEQGLNVANASLRSDNTSGYVGVIWHKASNKWQAQTMLKGKRVHIGLFNCKKEAGLAYNNKITQLFGDNCTFNKVFSD